MTKWILPLIALSALLAGCAKPAPEQPAGAPTTGEVVAYRDADGDLFCPVMKKKIASVDAAQGYQDHEGVRYYFCCGMCPGPFKADPAKYVAALK